MSVDINNGVAIGYFQQSRTSSSMPHSSSMVTQASMGKAISLPLRARCSSKGFPYDGFSIQASATHREHTRIKISTFEALQTKVKKQAY